LEALLCDYVDGTLAGPEKATVELHLSTCAECRELVADAKAAIAFMERAAEPEPPAELVNGILFEVRGGKSSPVRKPRGLGWIGRLFEPVLQPKFAMGMAMTILSFSMLSRWIPVHQLKPSDLEPAKVWATLEDKTWRTWERAKKYYESMRLVYEIQQTLKDWSETGEPQPDSSGAQTPPNKAQSGTPAMEGPIDNRPQGDLKKK
jgi:hypothetical protein